MAGGPGGCGRAFLQHTPVQVLLGLHSHQKSKKKSSDKNPSLAVGFCYTLLHVVVHFMHLPQCIDKDRPTPRVSGHCFIYTMCFWGKSLVQCTEQWGKVQEMWALPLALCCGHAGPPGPASAFFFSLAFSSLAQLN